MDITRQFAEESIRQMPRKEMLRNSGIKTGKWLVRFLSASQHYGPNLREILGVWQKSLCVFCRS